MEKKSSFQFQGYKVLKSLIELNGINNEELTLNFEPKGVLNNVHNTFTLEMLVHIFDEAKNINIEVIFEGEYNIVERDDNLKSFLFTNAPAILFPYIRAFISTLTALSGSSQITLPTMNLSNLKDKLSNNLTEINN
jgi:preprotein translocase subunit SecB